MLAMAVAARAEDTKQPAERIVFLGDSITQGGAAPGGYVTLVREALDKEHKELGWEVIGAGISGNKVPNLEQRLERDVLSKKPTIVVIYIGINDVWHSKSGKGTSKIDYEKGLLSLIEKIKAAGGRTILCTASMIGEKTDGTNDLDTMLDEYCELSRKVALETKEKFGTELLDLRKAFLAYLKEHNPDNKDKGILTGDGVHLNAAGNKFVAEQMLSALLPQKQEPAAKECADEKSAKASEPSVLRHVVLFKFKDGATKEQVQEVVDAFRALPGKIDSIKAFEYGTDNSPEKIAAGFTHCFCLTFADEAGRDAYLPHAAHEEFKKLVGPRLDKALVVDYWTKQ